MIGFCTGCFDLIHEGHFNFLKAAKDRCEYLIVGLTTDERCAVEKRAPVMSYAQRRTILLNSKWVDLVIENTGQSKEEMYNQLRFDVLFTTSEYLDRHEFRSFRKTFHNIPVIVFPVTTGIRTTQQIQGMETDVLNSMRILNYGISGPILLLDRRDSKLVLKPIHVGATEVVNPRTSNCYQLPIPPPRNWRRPGEEKRHPNIAGVNCFREIEIQRLIQGKPWNPVLQAIKVYDSLRPPLFGSIVEERKIPQQVYWMHQRYCGPTFFEWASAAPNEQIRQVLKEVKRIIDEELIPLGIAHGDLHSFNICVDPKTLAVSFIDWGWCMCRSFIMEQDEMEYFQQWLTTKEDWTHFVKSLEVDFPGQDWIPSLENP